MNNIILILSSVFLSAIAQILIKKGMLQVGNINISVSNIINIIPNMIINIYLWIAVICYILSLLVWMIVLSKIDVSYAYPFSSIGYIITLIAGYIIFNENITLPRIIGVCIVIIGVIIISKS